MQRIVGEEIDLSLAVHTSTGIINRFEYYEYNICLHNTLTKVGYIDLRLGYTDYLYYLGNVGYGIEEEYRGNSYAYKACLLIFEVARKLELPYLIITCDPDNVASNKTLQKLNGEFLGISKIPSTCMLYLQGDREKCIYRYDL